MKKGFIVVFMFTAVMMLYAEEMTIGTFKGMDVCCPAVSKVLNDAGLKTTVTVFNTQDELIRALAMQKIDGAFFLAQPVIAHVNGAVMIPVRLMNTDFYAVTVDKSVVVHNPGDLRKYTVGIVKGHPGHVAMTRGMKVVEAENEMEQFKQLAQGRFQVALSVSDLIRPMTGAAGISEYYVQEPPLMRTPTFFALSASGSKMKDRVEATFKNAVESGQWEKETAAIGR